MAKKNIVSSISLFLGVLAAGICFFLRHRPGFELSLYATIFPPILLYGPVRSWLKEMGGIRLTLLSSFLLSLIAAQLFSNSEKTYPLIRWAMYTSRAGAVPEFSELKASFADGSERIIPTQTTDPFRIRAFQYKIKDKLRLLKSAEEAGNLEEVAKLKTELAQVIELYVPSNASNPITEINLYDCTIDFKNFTGEQSVTKERVASLSLD